MLDVLDRRDVLHATTAESGESLVELLLRCLTEPRAKGMDRRPVYWGLLERIYVSTTVNKGNRLTKIIK